MLSIIFLTLLCTASATVHDDLAPRGLQNVQAKPNPDPYSSSKYRRRQFDYAMSLDRGYTAAKCAKTYQLKTRTLRSTTTKVYTTIQTSTTITTTTSTTYKPTIQLSTVTESRTTTVSADLDRRAAPEATPSTTPQRRAKIDEIWKKLQKYPTDGLRAACQELMLRSTLVSTRSSVQTASATATSVSTEISTLPTTITIATTTTVVSTSTAGTVCTDRSTIPAPTVVTFQTRAAAGGDRRMRRDGLQANALAKRAPECTATVVASVPAQYPTSCGVSFASKPTPTAGKIFCASGASGTGSKFRIEGNDSEGTIFDGCMTSKPGNITTASGGTHQCNGLNNNGNPAVGPTLTNLIEAAGRANGFGFDGSWSNQFEDFFITSIGNSQQTGIQFWGVLKDDNRFTAYGGCGEEYVENQRTHWIYNALNGNGFLRIEPDYAVVDLGDSAAITVYSDDGDGNSGVKAGATVAGQTSDSQGIIRIPSPAAPGCYQYKATANNYLRSNVFFLTVVASYDNSTAVDNDRR